MGKIREPKTLKEKRALEFARKLITDFKTPHVFSSPSREQAKYFTENGYPVSYITVRGYWEALETMGYVTREMYSRQMGVTYILNRYAFKKLLNNDAR